MGRLLRQSLGHKKLSVWKLVLMVLSLLISMEIILNLTIGFGPVIASILALIAVALGSVFCFVFIYKDLSKYDYRLIDKELILERSLGRANHVVYVILASDIISFISYNKKDKENKISWLKYLTAHNDKSKWYLISYKKDDKQMQLVIEPNEDFLHGLLEFIEKEATQAIIDIENIN